MHYLASGRSERLSFKRPFDRSYCLCYLIYLQIPGGSQKLTEQNQYDVGCLHTRKTGHDPFSNIGFMSILFGTDLSGTWQ